MKAIFTLTSSESKRLIARAVAQLPVVKAAMKKGYIYIAGGTTNAFIAEELTKIKISVKGDYTAGVITKGIHCVTDASRRIQPIVLKDGQPVEMALSELLEVISGRDVFIKGGNAIDPEGNVGIMVGEGWGGTIGRSMGRLMALGTNLILPVGLEKLVSSVKAASKFAGIDKVDYTLGMPIGVIPVSYGTVITELEALKILADLEDVIHIGSGGIGGSEGAVTLGIEGTEKEVKKAIELIKEIKGEPPVHGTKRKCSECGTCHFGRGK
ncbi:hypothetical protein BBF96_02945 [Anoxybacter fermentans]|uniref:Uncharacterized protein n=1 Tax=Anoxybacter fermentans TaxID=1323375 RepID=A0A3S9SW29_9FIRM|nr:hypothetical protein [Anoxybacter fermentans]AZR72440.1 hypothetical protein BBF96_02945 [Anoxybacter fermentans]